MPITVNELDRVIDDTVRPRAEQVDASGEFPKVSLEALAASGVMGLPIAESVGGGGGELADAVMVVRKLAGACGSTAMIVLMHYVAAALIDRHGPDEIRKEIAAGEHLTTLAFSESGSRSQFWVPLGTATASTPGRVRLDAAKSWITAAGEANSYVWSSQPLDAEGPMTLWLVPAGSAGLSEPGAFDGLGLRGNRSAPVVADGVEVPEQAMLGADGSGLDIALADVLPWFLVLNAAFSVGLMEAVTEETGAHLQSTRLEHLDQSLAESQVARMDHARMRIATDQAAALLTDTLAALAGQRADAMLRVLEVKAAAGEAAAAVTDLAMKVCGGAAFRKELGIERRFRDARALRVMAPTSDTLLDFVGRAINGLPLL
ncbi:MAG TPA: acyl-CoA dehydrogenase family protein [Acidimicrobiales bacterium]|nr:acyl-CoA dehydrogenase family protein [Acidimicrobiales bacterium]